MIHAAIVCVSLASCLGLAQPAPHAEPAPAPDTGPVPNLIRRYETEWNDLRRFHDLAWSEARIARLREHTESWRGAIAGVDEETLDRSNQVDAALLTSHLDHARADLDLEARRLAEMGPVLPFRGAVQRIVTESRDLRPVDPATAAAALSPLVAELKSVRARIEAGRKNEAPAPGAKPEEAPIPVSPVVALRASGATDAIRRQLDEWYEFHAGFEPDFSWWVRQPYDAVRGALEEHAKYLREEIAGQKGGDDDPLVGDPIGREALLADLRAEMIPYTPEELIAIGNRELAWCEAEMKKAAAEMGPGDDWRAALARVKADHVPPGKQDELAAEQSRFAILWLKERDLVTIPPMCEETWRLRMITPVQQKTWPFAVYFGQAMGVSYPTDGMKHDDKLMSMRGNNRHFNRIVTPHELIPGHHLQGYVESRVRPYRRMFSTPFLVEGWALHWEMLLWDLGYPASPEDRIGMLFWRSHRCARITVSLRFHLGEMTPAQMIDFLVERVGHERFGATSEVRRYIAGDYSPLYQCGYMIGGLQVRALHSELVGHGTMTHRQFHDAVLREGPIPVALMRAALMPSRTIVAEAPAWRFAGD
ncbi:MAG: DUF885 domain-containing protein [Phycisphaerales bacterium]|nr:DUF885 domain-containing protein [Phycisphaerales bacterium]